MKQDRSAVLTREFWLQMSILPPAQFFAPRGAPLAGIRARKNCGCKASFSAGYFASAFSQAGVVAPPDSLTGEKTYV
jgi:hypothetical protein